jgi:hypothetical protein
MKVFQQQIVEIEISKLLPHPKNANVMSLGVMKKLRRHIEKTGRYEPLVVRRHPSVAGSYELINGHHRKRVLEELGHERAACVVWELDDVETLMLLATINRLGGEDAPGKRLELLEAMSEQMGVGEMSKWVPEDAEMLGKLLRRGEVVVRIDPPRVGEMEEAFTVFLKHEEKRRLVEALRREGEDSGAVLMGWVGEREGGEMRNAECEMRNGGNDER